jgi:hypothetical protein
MRRTLRILTMTAMLVVTIASTAIAGNIAVVSFDDVPPDFQAGTNYRLDYSILAHGTEPIELVETAVRFHGPDGETLTFPAKSTSKGQWTVDVTLPEAGEWRWEVIAGTQVMQQLGTLTVESTPVAAAPSSLLTSLRIGLPIVTLLALVLLASQLLPRARTVRRPTPTTDVV